MLPLFRLTPLLLSAAPGRESLLSLVFSSGLLVQFVLLGLVGMSVFTWAIIIAKRKILGQTEGAARAFTEAFDGAGSLDAAYRLARTGHREAAPARVLSAGYEEAQRDAREAGSEQAIRRVGRAMGSAVSWECLRLERRLPFLATTGATAPFIGLFGTVWGIMRSFRDIGAMRSADLSVVAPGIAEALVATAAGLFAAIPAVMAYNAYVHRIRNFRRYLEDFAEQSLSRIERQWPKG